MRVVLSQKALIHDGLRMTRYLEDVVDRVREVHFAFPAASEKEIDSARKRGVPEKLLDFYRLCDGAYICKGADFRDPNGRFYRFMIPRLKDLITVQSFGFIFQDSPLYDASAKWWQIVDYGDSNWLAFDASLDSRPRIIDISHETVGERQSHMIVANSMAELVERLMRCGGAYWFDEGFQRLGYV